MCGIYFVCCLQNMGLRSAVSTALAFGRGAYYLHDCSSVGSVVVTARLALSVYQVFFFFYQESVRDQVCFK